MIVSSYDGGEKNMEVFVIGAALGTAISVSYFPLQYVLSKK